MSSASVDNEKIRALVFTSLGHYLNDTFLILISILIVYYLLAGISVIFLAAMSAIYGIISGLLSTPVGSIADRRGNYAKLMLLGFVLIGVANISFALSFLSYNIYLIAIGSILLGSGAAFYHPLGGSILQL
ncbi:MAG: MFS transporter, partial [Nitrososphaerota archaeon]|nr:MFS transporter [Nitrososphaerota archaeon]